MVKVKGEGENWGVRIRRRATDKVHGRFEYEFYLAPYAKGAWFVTNQTLRSTLEGEGAAWKEKFKENPLGSVEFRLMTDAKLVYAEKFTPFGYFKPFRKTGLAALLEMQVVKDIIEALGPEARQYNYKVGWRAPGSRRVKQYNKRGLHLGQELPLLDYYQSIRRQIREGVKKARARARQPAKPKARPKAKPKKKAPKRRR